MNKKAFALARLMERHPALAMQVKKITDSSSRHTDLIGPPLQIVRMWTANRGFILAAFDFKDGELVGERYYNPATMRQIKP